MSSGIAGMAIAGVLTTSVVCSAIASAGGDNGNVPPPNVNNRPAVAAPTAVPTAVGDWFDGRDGQTPILRVAITGPRNYQFIQECDDVDGIGAAYSIELSNGWTHIGEQKVRDSVTIPVPAGTYRIDIETPCPYEVR